MYIKVIHQAFEDTPETVAVVNCPHAVIEEALEYAYRYTNNVDGSWALMIGSDANDNVEVVKPIENGRGHRSTSVGDHMQVFGKTYRVAGVGFELVN